MKAFYDEKPSRFEAVGDGSHVYRWKIEEVENSSLYQEGDTLRLWTCQEVIVWEVSSKKITEAVIRELWGTNHEQKLINEYNAVQLGGIYDKDTSERIISDYRTFLEERAAVKAQVDKDCEELNIN